jgi:hypothetical protein
MKMFLLHKQNFGVSGFYRGQHRCRTIAHTFTYRCFPEDAAYAVLFREIISRSNLNVINIFRDVF